MSSMLQPAKGRGRGRVRNHPPPSITFSSSLTPTLTSSTTSLDNSGTTDNYGSDSGFSSIISSTKCSSHSQISTWKYQGRVRGRGIRVPFDGNVVLTDSLWTVTDLTYAQFQSNERPNKPDELGTLGDQIQVMANYFPILQFPHRGLVYKYQIQIRNRKNLEIPRDRRRVLYNTWLKGFSRRNPQVDPHKIVFDNQARILAFGEPLLSIDENEVTETVMGPNRSNRQEPHTVIVQGVGTPVDLAMLQNLNQLFNAANQSNEKLDELQNIKQVLSIALHEHCSSHAAFVYNRTFYSSVVEGQYGDWDLGMGNAMWRGFYSCLVFGKGKYQLLMNLDVSYSVFLKKQPFLEFVCEVMLQSPSGKRDYGNRRHIRKVDGNDVLKYLDSRSPMYQSNMDFLLKHCKYVRVRSQNADKPIIYEIQKLGLPAAKQEFQWKSNHNQITTIKNYYREHHNIDLQYPSLPTLEMRNGSCIPLELVDVEPARVIKISDEQRALLCKYSSMRPSIYCEAINQIRTHPQQQSFEKDPFVRAWNLNVDVQMITVPARVLPMPEIVYDEQYQVKPQKARNVGIWELTRSTRFYKPTAFPKVWAMINLSSLNQDACEEYYTQLSMVAQQRGINLPPPDMYEERNARDYPVNRIVTEVGEMMKRNSDCRFILVILPNNFENKSRIYGFLKKLFELQLGPGVVSQMIRENNAVVGTRRDRTKWDATKLSNVLLKINTKLNGINSTIKVPDIISRFFSRGHRIMYVGADLNHPAPIAGNQTSVAAVVASADDIPNRYFKEVYKQNRPSQTRKESRDLIVSMREIMKSLIEQYNQHRHCPPTAIVIYRDGISEGEFYSVFDKELTAIRQACADLSPSYRPCLTYIVVNKRHRTRFFPTDSDRNVPAGTVVDSHDITNPTTYDFFLNSHHGALGTSRPAHYHVLYDDNNLKPDEVQMLTYALCYTYARCTRSVSVPAPVKYADLLAFRASYYIDIDDESDTETVAPGPYIPINQDTELNNSIKSERIVLSSKIDADCPFFL